MRIEAVRRFHFCAGHRVYQHESKCSNLHGHNYILFVHAFASELDELGRVIDFAVLKARIDTWLQDKWDHTMLVYQEDKELLSVENLIPKKKPWFICSFNPTAENMGKYLFNEVIPSVLHGSGVHVSKLELWETENCKVEISRN